MAAPAWVHELPFEGAWPTMSARGEPAAWPEDPPGRAGDDEDRAERAVVLAAHRAEVVLVADHPVAAAAVAEACAVAGVDDLGDAAVASGDDLCLLAPDGGWPLVAGAVLWPSHWRLAEHLGRPIGGVHGRVPGYDGVAGQVERVLGRLVPGGRALRRANVLWHALPDRWSPRPPPAAVQAAVEPGEWWLRSERQTLRRLSVTGAVLFTFRTRQVRLGALLDVEPALAGRLAAHLRAMAPARVAYAGLAADRDRLVRWLSAAAPAVTDPQ